MDPVCRASSPPCWLLRPGSVSNLGPDELPSHRLYRCLTTPTFFQAAGLFLVFGVRMLHEGLTMSKSDSSDKMAEEIREVEEELSGAVPLDDLEEGKSSRASPSRPASPWGDRSGPAAGQSIGDRMQSYLGLVASPVFVQAFMLTFLGEWGDRSQIATIALAAAHVRSS